MTSIYLNNFFKFQILFEVATSHEVAGLAQGINMSNTRLS
jgi:hypothetical protein